MQGEETLGNAVTGKGKREDTGGEERERGRGREKEGNLLHSSSYSPPLPPLPHTLHFSTQKPTFPQSDFCLSSSLCKRRRRRRTLTLRADTHSHSSAPKRGNNI